MKYLFSDKTTILRDVNTDNKSYFWIVLLCCVSFVLASCQTYVAGRHRSAERVAEKYHMSKRLVKGGKFWLLTYQKIQNPGAPYAIYIEGDGLAFRTKYEISDDPTPLRPMLLTLAGMDTRTNVVYIARPCQYVMEIDSAVCKESYWSDKRMSDEVVSAMNDAIVNITHKAPVDLVGFSGGGGIALLVAAKNPQIKSVLTIAGNLDHVAFNQYHHARPMLGSLNPIDYATKIRNIPQLHFSGGKDKVIPAFIGDKFVKASNSKCVHHEVIPDVEHQYGWDRYWSYVLSAPLKCY